MRVTVCVCLNMHRIAGIYFYFHTNTVAGFLRGEAVSWLASVSLVLGFVALYILPDVGNQLSSFYSIILV